MDFWRGEVGKGAGWGGERGKCSWDVIYERRKKKQDREKCEILSPKQEIVYVGMI